MRRPLLLIAAAVIVVGCAAADPAASSSSPAAPAPEPISSDSPALGATPVSSTPTPTAPDQPGPTTATETTVWIPAGDHRVPGTLAVPALTPGQVVPAVLLLHGDFSSRDENANLFGRLASALSARGIASLRIDFAGSGASEEPDLALDYPGMVLDATASLKFLEGQPSLDATKLAVLGLSRGGSIAATVAGTVPGVAALVSWSGAIANAYEEDPDAHERARADGEVVIDLGDREFHVSLAWFDTISDSHPLDDVAGFANPVLAVVGSDDDVVSPEISDIFLARVASPEKSLHVVDGGDHGFAADPEYGDEAIAVTTGWLADRFLN
ncbi:MAG: alpha/beta fold hydrolase [Nakamurella sp.]